MGCTEVVGYSKAQGEMAKNNALIVLKMSQNINKSMAYSMNKSGGDFQHGGYLYKLTSGIQWTPEHSWTSDRPQKQAQKKQTS